MSHERVFGGVREVHNFLCDGAMCDETFEDEGCFTEVWDKAKDEGWRAIKDRTKTWCHYCPNCIRDEGVALY